VKKVQALPMFRIPLVVLLAVPMLVLPAAGAAQPKEPATPVVASKDAAKDAAKAPAKPAAVAKKPRRGEDARHCLERASNTEIIRCAEAYL